MTNLSLPVSNVNEGGSLRAGQPARLMLYFLSLDGDPIHPVWRAAVPQTEESFLFVDNIRFVSMACIVAMHTMLLPLDPARITGDIVLMQMMKFSTICFFLIGGFLLGTKIERERPLRYFLHRLDSTFLPWLLWFCAYAFLEAASRMAHKGPSPQALVSTIASAFLYSSYWFIPNFMLSLGILLLFRKYILRLWFGAIWAAVSVFYGVNLYLRWLPTDSTTAVFGYVFYLWLGCFISRKREKAQKALDSINGAWFVLALALGLAASLFEAGMLQHRTRDFLNTLRVSNQVFSLVAFASLLRIKRRLSPAWMDVRKHTFGIYLTHAFILYLYTSLFVHIMAGAYSVSSNYYYQKYLLPETNPGTRLLVWAAAFAVTYASSWLAAFLLARSGCGRLIGARETVGRDRAAPRVLPFHLPALRKPRDVPRESSKSRQA